MFAPETSPNQVSFSAEALQSLALFRYRVTFQLKKPLLLDPVRRAILWRGAFGYVFRSLVCHDLQLDCKACPALGACPYPRVFAAEIPPNRPQILRLADPPRPFILTDPFPMAPALPADEPLALGLTIVGSAIADLPYLIVTLRQLGEAGLGAERVPFQLLSIHPISSLGVPAQPLFQAPSQHIATHNLPTTAADLMRPGDGQVHRVKVHFLTPTELKGDYTAYGHGNSAPTFGTLIRRIQGRASALATFFGSAPFTYPFQHVAALADTVHTHHAEMRHRGVIRRSARTRQTHPVEGLVGTVIYQGEAVGTLMPLLRLAEVIGVGKHATFGNGKIGVET
ncbi:MAG: CRISPR system precrRNA processing endoribonuclease RAMP protein Cas6 [Polyangiaceae bacterium]|nr:CRISPR system precrRNA processing endoribonuclease RAMP protein Cas6 [Polyangiaceae bacterium]